MALVRSLACVGAKVRCQNALRCEPLAAISALVWPFAGVDPKVRFQVVHPYKSVGTEGTLKGALLSVSLQVVIVVGENSC